MATPSRDLTIHWYEGDISPIEGKLDLLMAAIDDLTAKFDALSTAVHGLLDREGAVHAALQTEIDTLKADDTIEDGKLVGLSTVADDLLAAVDAFAAVAPIDVEPIA